jgi:L-threonylcarbamoyladenylate synthase
MKVIWMTHVMGDMKTRREVLQGIRDGGVFIYPTDTLYGLGCDATNSVAVKRIRRIKASKKQFSVIAPSNDWVMKSLEVRGKVRKEYLERLPGPYTLIFRMKKEVVCKDVASGKLGVRVPDHPFTRVVQEAGVPFVTTSVNLSGDKPLWSISGVSKDIGDLVDFGIDDGIIKNPPSQVIDMTGKKPRILR